MHIYVKINVNLLFSFVSQPCTPPAQPAAAQLLRAGKHIDITAPPTASLVLQHTVYCQLTSSVCLVIEDIRRMSHLSYPWDLRKLQLCYKNNLVRVLLSFEMRFFFQFCYFHVFKSLNICSYIALLFNQKNLITTTIKILLY